MQGQYMIPSSNTNNETFFNSLVFDVEKDVLRGDGFRKFGLLGDVEYIKLIADLDMDGNPQTQKYIDLINGVNYVKSNGETAIFGGIKEMLKGFIYKKFSDTAQYSLSKTGQHVEQTENAIKPQEWQTVGANRYNLAADLYNIGAYNYIYTNRAQFPDWDFTRVSRFFINGFSFE